MTVGSLPLSAIRLTAGVTGHRSLLEESANVGLANPAIVASIIISSGFGVAPEGDSASSLAAETSGFNRYTIPDFNVCNISSNLDDCASRLVTQNLWFLDEVVTDPTMSVRVQLQERAVSVKADIETVRKPGTNITAADSSRLNLDQHIVVTGWRNGHIANLYGQCL